MSASERVSRVYFVFMDIQDEPVRVNSSGQSLYWDGYEWLGVGQLGEMSGITDDTQMSATNLTLTINDVPLALISALDSADYQERKVSIWQADLSDSYAVASSVLVWSGTMDAADIEVGSVGTIQMRCESLLARWNNATPRRMNDQIQQRLYPGDRGLQYVAACANVSIQL